MICKRLGCPYRIASWDDTFPGEECEGAARCPIAIRAAPPKARRRVWDGPGLFGHPGEDQAGEPQMELFGDDRTARAGLF